MSTFCAVNFEIMKEKLGERLRFIRTQQGLSQQNVADELGITVAAYSNIERGVTNINITRLYEIAEILKTTPSKLLEDDTNHLSDNANIYFQGVSSQINFINQQVNILQQEVTALKNEMRSLKAGK